MTVSGKELAERIMEIPDEELCQLELQKRILADASDPGMFVRAAIYNRRASCRDSDPTTTYPDETFPDGVHVYPCTQERCDGIILNDGSDTSVDVIGRCAMNPMLVFDLHHNGISKEGRSNGHSPSSEVAVDVPKSARL